MVDPAERTPAVQHPANNRLATRTTILQILVAIIFVAVLLSPPDALTAIISGAVPVAQKAVTWPQKMFSGTRAQRGQGQELRFQKLPTFGEKAEDEISQKAVLMHWVLNYESGSNAQLVEQLATRNLIQSTSVRKAFETIDRKNFVPPQLGGQAYEDHPLPIGFGATISAPHMHAICLELLAGHLRPGTAALDIGSGSGYFTALMAVAMADGAEGPVGKVIGVEHVEALVDWSKANVARQGNPILNTAVVLRGGDGRRGDEEHAPFVAIHVGAAVEGFPTVLVDQLAVGGRMVMPMADPTGQQFLTVVDKVGPEATDIVVSKRFAVQYVPLTDRSYYG